MRFLKRMPYVTYLLLFIIIAVYIAMTFSGGTDNSNVLLEYGAIFNPLVRAGEWWRLITAIFLHMNFTHILFNGLVLYFMGIQIEKLFGHLRFAIIFFGSGIVGNLFGFAFTDGISAGASTAIFGLFGAFMMLGESFNGNQEIRRLSKSFIIFIVMNLLLDLITPNVDIAGHIGGLISGFLIAYIVSVPHYSLSRKKRMIALIVMIIVILILFYVGMNGNY
ncbi:rhomboid family intramembrane serine protease [Philodulcilactobacillus myokoensis]|uniref:Rhomboid family intramembrane serine protease n=1 Tax=Philodulcilactobacillus myokoensis TaxID=2929573 RepID=A0A9W6B0X6_9LACO|nr:rhomboid family intramembrane serine protease [Philodulcilactobacillus myokoensis]GLB46782.1 rhomboid family intramembrane serine protease [Philodulcilactobacillus myokoensis]